MSPWLRSSWPLLALASTLAVGCADDPTQIVVVVNSDLESGTDIDEVELQVDGSTLLQMVPTPRTALLVHRGGELGPITVMVRGLRDGLRRIAREAVVEFVEGKTVLLNVCLSRNCLEDTSCSASRTCTETGCRSPVMGELPEYNGTIPTSCGAIVGDDAGVLDAAIDATDSGVDTSTDVGPVCVLTGGICNVGDVVMPGDRLEPMPCDPSEADITWQWGPVGAASDVTLPFHAGAPGGFVLEATQPDVAGCTASFDVMVNDVRRAGNVGAPTEPVVDLAAAPGVAFATTRTTEAWAILPTRWVDVRMSASGTRPSGDLECVGALGRTPLFGTVDDESGLFTVMSTPDFASNDWDSLSLIDADDRGYAASSPANGSAPLAVAYGEGIAVVNDTAGDTDLLLNWDARVGADIAISLANPDAYGEIWVSSRERQEVRNIDIAGGDEYNDGNTQSVDVGQLNAIEVTENAGRANLWICGSEGLHMYDLRDAIDLDAPTRDAPVAPCHDVAVDGMGGIWVAASSGLQRFDTLGDLRANLARVGGYAHVAYAEGPTGREIWAVASDNEVQRLTER